MAVPFIQLGQCGNQIGSNFYDIMYQQGLKSSNAHQSLLEQFFYLDTNKKDIAKAIQIDMQPKVVNKNLTMNRNWKYDRKLSFVREQGSGNNWAYGCNVHGPQIKQKIQKLMYTFAEKQDYINAIVQIQSLAGGTGSGVGTFIIRLLNDIFPKTPKFITCVMPHLSGQVILQSYNACLSIGTIYKQADGIFIIQNDEINDICTKNLKIDKISLNDINEVIGRTLSSVYFPLVNKNAKNIFSIQQNGLNYGIDFIENVFSDAKYKLASLDTTPHGPKKSQNFNFDSWQAIQNDLLHNKKNIQNKGSLLIARGNDHPQILNSNMPTYFDKHMFYNYNRSGSLILNGPGFVNSFEKILDRGYSMFKQNAYLYQYEKYGIEKQNFLQCFCVIEDIQQCYKRLL